MNYFIDKDRKQQLLKEWKNFSLKKKVKILKESKEIDKKYNLPYSSHSEKRKWRKLNSLIY